MPGWRLIILFFIGQLLSCYYYGKDKTQIRLKKGQIFVRVRLINVKEGTNLLSEGELFITTLRKTKKVRGGEAVKLTATGKKVTVKMGNTILFCESDTVSFSSKGLIQVGARRYRGEIKAFFSPESGLIVINRLPLEWYLYGVIPCEIGPIQPETFSAIKAQAVAARSFTIARLDKRKGRGYDLYDSYLRDQEYQGAGREVALGNKAVDETAGEVLVYKGEIAEALYHNCCGGITAQGFKEYLKPVFDTPGHKRKGAPFCASSPHYFWQVTISRDSLERVLTRIAGLKTKIRIKSFKLTKCSVSQRVREIAFTTAQGEVTLSGENFRFALGLNSQMFDMKLTGKKVTFTGKGWGHGVGLCQTGAVEMARRGYNYQQILKHYYPELKIRRRY